MHEELERSRETTPKSENQKSDIGYQKTGNRTIKKKLERHRKQKPETDPENLEPRKKNQKKNMAPRTEQERRERRRTSMFDNLPEVTEEKNGALSPLQIETLDQLNEWMGQDPDAVLEAIHTLRTNNGSLIQDYNALLEEHDEQKTTLENEKTTLENEKTRLEDEKAALEFDLEESRTTAATQRDQLIQLRRARESTPATEHSNTSTTIKIIKLPDPKPLSDGIDPTYDSWLSKIKKKLKENAYLFPTEGLRIAYVETRTEGRANKHLQPRMREDTKNPFKNTTEMYDCLAEIFQDHDRKHTARTKYERLRQGSKDLTTFWAEFQYLMSDVDNTDESFIADFRNKLHTDIQRQLTGMDPPTNIYEFARKCIRIESDLKNVRSAENRYAARAQRTAEANTPKPTPAARPYLPRSHTTATTFDERTDLMRQGKCFVCKQHGHLAINCPSKENQTSVNRVSAIEQDDSGKE